MSLLVEITEQDAVQLIEIAGAGPQGVKGDTGDQGPVGPGVPAGGVEFDLIEKASADDFDTRYTSVPTVRGIQLSTTNPADVETGRIVWNDGDEVPQFRSNGITVDLSLEMLARCRNVTGALIPKGTAVCIVGASAQRISIAPSNRTEPGSACRTLGLTLEPIANNNFGKVSTFGLVPGLNTAGIDGAEGDELFVGETPGSLTTTPPDAPARRLTVGYLVTKSVNQGRIFVSIRRGVRVDEIDDVQVDSVADGDVIRFDDAAGRWENKSLGTAADSDVGDFDAAGSADAVQSNLETHIDDATNPHEVTAEQVGLGNVDNTADLDKPISNDTQAALNDKADKATQIIAGTGLDGGGDLSGDRTLNLDSATVASLGLADSALQSGDNVSELTNDAGYIDAAGAPVQSVNGETGDVSLDAGDVGLGNVPNLDTTDAVAKAHDQNTDTALASGTADEVTAAEILQYRSQFAGLTMPQSAIVAWDDFRTDSADLHGRVSPSGAVWSVVDATDASVVTGQAEVTGGRVVFDNTSIFRAAVVPISDVRGVTLQCHVGAINRARIQFIVFSTNGDSVFFDSRGQGGGRGFRKTVDGLTTNLSIPSGIRFAPENNEKAITFLNFDVRLNVGEWCLGYTAGGVAESLNSSDSDVNDILSDPAFIGVSFFENGRLYGIRILEAV